MAQGFVLVEGLKGQQPQEIALGDMSRVPMHLDAQANAVYSLHANSDEAANTVLKLKREGNDLHIHGGEGFDVVLDGFFITPNVGLQGLELGSVEAAGAQGMTDYVSTLVDGGELSAEYVGAPYAGPVSAESAGAVGVVAAAGSSNAWLAGVGLLALGGGGGGGGGGDAVATLATPSIDDVVDTNGDGQLEISGTAPAGSTVRIALPGGLSVLETNADASGRYALVFDPDGVYQGTYTVTAVDGLGRHSDAVTRSERDLLAPVVSITDLADIDGSNAPTLWGTVEALSTLTVTAPDGAHTTFTVAADASGQFSVKLTDMGFTPGTYTVTAKDAAGNGSLTVTHSEGDLHASVAVTDIVDNDGNGYATAIGTGDAGSTVTVQTPDSTGTTFAAVVDGSGHFSFELGQNPAPTGTYSVWVTDEFGNRSVTVEQSESDLTAPSLSLTDIRDIAGALAPTAYGLGEAGSTVVVTAPNSQTYTTVVSSDGSYSLSLAKEQEVLGTYSVVAWDAAGNRSLEVTRNEVDLLSPSLVVTDIYDLSGSTDLEIWGEAREQAMITVTAPDGITTFTANTDANGHYEFTLSGQAYVSGTFAITATDVQGNTSTTINKAATPRPASPTVDDIVDSNGDGLLEISGTAPAGTTVRIALPDNVTVVETLADASGHYSLVFEPKGAFQGTYTVVAQEGRHVSLPTHRSEPDLTAPIVSITDLADIDGSNAPTMWGTVEALSTLTVTAPDAAHTTFTAAADASGQFILKLTDMGFTPGTYTVTAKDVAGNGSLTVTHSESDLHASASVTDIVDNDGNGYATAIGTGDAGSTVTVQAPGAPTTTFTTVVDSSGQFSFELDQNPAPTGTYSVWVTDEFGNRSATVEQSESDLTAPMLSLTDIADLNGGQHPTAWGNTEANAKVTVSIDGHNETFTAMADASGNFSVELTNQRDVPGTYSAYAEDAAGNHSFTVSRSETDLLSPNLTVGGIYDLPDSDNDLEIWGDAGEAAVITVTSPSGVTYTATSNDIGYFEFTLSGQVYEAGSFSVTVRDLEGNTSSTVQKLASPAPAAPSIEYVKDSNGDGTLEIYGSATVGTSVRVTLPSGAILGPLIVDATGHFSASFTPPVGTTGEGSYSATASLGLDGYLNLSTPGTYDASDLMPPPLKLARIADLENDGTWKVMGVTETGATVTVSAPSGGSFTALGVSNAYELDMTGHTLMTGTYAVSVQDAAGNGQSETFHVISGAGVFSGTSADELIVGSGAADWIATGGGVDQLFGGGGDDVFVLSAADVANLTAPASATGWEATIDGSVDIDTLRLQGAVSLDLSAVLTASGALGSRITSVEAIDLFSDTSSNQVTLSLEAVLAMGSQDVYTGPGLGAASGVHQVRVNGASNDTVHLADASNWTSLGNAMWSGVTYGVWESNTPDAQILIQDGVVMV